MGPDRVTNVIGRQGRVFPTNGSDPPSPSGCRLAHARTVPIRDNRTYANGATKQGVPLMNIDKWADKEAAAAFRMGVTRWTEYAILHNDPGAMSRVMGEWWGKLIFQFRSFVMGAWSRHLMHNIHMRDMETAMTFLLTGIGGVMTHVAVSHLRTIGDPKREDKLDKDLSWTGLVFGGFQRTSWSSFVPSVADAALGFAGVEPVFGFRMSGQPANFITGNPTFSLMYDAQKATAGLLGNLSSDNDLSQQDVRSVLRVFPWGNWIPFNVLMNNMISELPDFDERPRRERAQRAF